MPAQAAAAMPALVGRAPMPIFSSRASLLANLWRKPRWLVTVKWQHHGISSRALRRGALLSSPWHLLSCQYYRRHRRHLEAKAPVECVARAREEERLWRRDFLLHEPTCCRRSIFQAYRRRLATGMAPEMKNISRAALIGLKRAPAAAEAAYHGAGLAANLKKSSAAPRSGSRACWRVMKT